LEGGPGARGTMRLFEEIFTSSLRYRLAGNRGGVPRAAR
jgi:hypothetical protein